MGPSNSGKSTLAAAIGRARGLPVVHLDQLRHLPNTDWQERPDSDFAALHDMSIAGERWVVEGNYSALLPQRLERATGVILLDVPTATSLWRYVRRCCWEKGRHGGLEGGRDSVKWDMIRHILWPTRANRARYRRMFAGIARPKRLFDTRETLACFYAEEGLRRD